MPCEGEPKSAEIVVGRKAIVESGTGSVVKKRGCCQKARKELVRQDLFAVRKAEEMSCPVSNCIQYTGVMSVFPAPHMAPSQLWLNDWVTSSVTSRPLEGEAPTIDLVVGYSKANTSPILKLFLSRMDALIDRSTPSKVAVNRPNRN